MARSRLLIPLAGGVAVTLVLSIVGLVLVDGDDDAATIDTAGSVSTVPAEATTTSGVSDPLAGATTVPSIPDLTTQTTAGIQAGTTTSSTARRSTTTAGGKAKAPGALTTPKAGSYAYPTKVTDAEGKTSDVTAKTVYAAAGAGKLLQTQDTGNMTLTQRVAWGGTASVDIEHLKIKSGTSEMECDLNPVVPEYLRALGVGAAWKYTSSCTGTFKGGDADGTTVRVDLTGDLKVTAQTTAATGAGESVPVWVITGTTTFGVTLVSSPNPQAAPLQGQKITDIANDQVVEFSPDHGVPVHSVVNSTVTAFGQKSTAKADGRLAALAPTA